MQLALREMGTSDQIEAVERAAQVIDRHEPIERPPRDACSEKCSGSDNAVGRRRHFGCDVNCLREVHPSSVQSETRRFSTHLFQFSPDIAEDLRDRGFGA